MPFEQDIDRSICTEPGHQAAQSLPHGVVAGALVVARSERWHVLACTLHEDCAELHLTNAASGSAVLLWPFDRVDVMRSDRPLRVTRLRRWVARMTVHSAGPRAGRLRVTASRARILPYQLSPALAIANGQSRILLADEVGLGKTIQAGWIIADATARHIDARVLIVVPAGLRDQWTRELSTHFAIQPIGADARWLRRTAADLPGDVNPWSLPGVYLTSLDFLKRPDVVRSLEHMLWDVLVIDEVHTAASPTDRHAALAKLACRSRALVMISATPFSGDPESFDSIARLGALQEEFPPLMFRRSREDVGALGGRRHRFASVRLDQPEQRLQRLLDRYTREVWRESGEERDRSATGHDIEGARLAMTVLRKRALSSPQAALRSLEHRLNLLGSEARSHRQLDLFDVDEDPLDDEEPDEALSAPGLRDAERERRWLTVLIDAARGAVGSDSKLRFLERLRRRIRGDSAIVFTEYRDTLAQLATVFPQSLLLHGGMAPSERNDVQQQFNREGGLLIATDAAAEGLNLHGHCRFVINYELPWNPARLEQRIGRVDRIGQERPVHALTLVARHTAEDLVLAKLARRLHRIAVTFGERDRLTAFLDEPRIANLVIGGAKAVGVERPSQPTILRSAGDTTVDGQEADRLVILQNTPGRCQPTHAVLVSVTRSNRNLAEGYVFLVRWTATTIDGTTVDCDIFAIHIRASGNPTPSTAAAARAIAAAAIACHGGVVAAAADGQAAPRLDKARKLHNAITLRLATRERALLSNNERPALLQPGLFDRRAVEQADEVRTTAEALRAAHERRLIRLERSASLEGRCDVIGVLIVARNDRT
jgi:superfamily II DNA or RNA helicase